MFLLIDCVLLLVGLVWICHSLKHDKEVMGNEKWMLIHNILLFTALGAWIYSSTTIIKTDGEEAVLLPT